MTEPWPVNRSNTTIKYGKDHDPTWVVAYGNPHEQARFLTEYFGLENTEGLTPHQIGLMAAEVAQSDWSAYKGLGARPVSKAASEAPVASQGHSTGDAWSRTEKPAHKHQLVLDLIESATTKDELRDIYVDHTEAMSDETVVAALQARSAEVA